MIIPRAVARPFLTQVDYGYYSSRFVALRIYDPYALVVIGDTFNSVAGAAIIP